VARDHGWKASGVEPSAWAVAEGVRRFGVGLRQALVEDLDEPPGSADVVVMFDVLEHLTQPVEALRTIRPLVQDEGLLALSTVNVESLHARARRGSWPWFIRSHLFYFSPRTLTAVLSAAGFRLVEWRTVPRSFRLSYLSRRMASAWPTASRAAAALSNVSDLRLPLGWLGDIVLAVARPS
jgi:SAM-dependent methyltransferase